MTTPRMMPGQEPYNDDELRRLYAALGEAADADPGEQAEPPAWPGLDYDTHLLPSSWPGRRGEQAEPHPQLARLERVAAQLPPAPTCRCCGHELIGYAALQAMQDGAGIHTRCITRHWGKHAHGANVGRCREFATA